MNRGINRQEARLGKSTTDLQGVCARVHALFFNLWAPEWGERQCSKRNTLHTLLSTHKHKHTPSQIYMKRFYKTQIIMIMKNERL